ncbi:hypothetical protein KR018_004840, partial [Drosophila ironensis]
SARGNGGATAAAEPVATAAATPSPAQEAEHLRKIFIGGLSTHTTVETVREFFRQFGPVADAVVMRDPMTNHSRGFGFVTFAESKSVDNVQRARPHNIDNKVVETKHALPRHDFVKSGGGTATGGAAAGAIGTGGPKSTKIFLGGLKECHDEQSIRNYFSLFGPITSLKLLMDKDTGRKRGFGFLEFENALSADRAINQGKHMINMSTVEVKRSTQKPESGKRLRFPVGGAARAGYIPPQPASLDSYSFTSSSYNPYLAQSVLPPSAYINGWATYVAPPMQPPANPVMYAPQKQHVPAQNPQQAGGYMGGFGGGYQQQEPWGAYQKYGNQEWTPSNLNEWPPKAGHKHAQTSTNDRQHEPKSDPGARGDADGAGSVLTIASGPAKKWPTDDYKIFKPAQRATPAYGMTPMPPKSYFNQFYQD